MAVFIRVGENKNVSLFRRGRCCVFSACAGLVRELDTAAAWALSDACFLFLPANAPETADILLKGAAELYRLYEGRRGFFWLKNPDAPPSLWAYESLSTGRGGMLLSSAIRFQRYRLIIGDRTTVTRNGDEIEFCGQRLLWALPGGVAPVDSRLTLSLEGDKTGQIAGECRIPDNEPLRQLDACLCYAFTGNRQDGVEQSCLLKSSLMETSRPLSLRFSVNPCDAPGEGPVFLFREGTELTCHFRTVRGDALSMKSLPGAGLAWAMRPEFLWTSPEGLRASSNLYLTYAGGFELSSPSSGGSDEVCRLLCGFSGTEYVGFRQKTVIQFHPGRTSFCHPGGKTRLSLLCDTAWISMRAEEREALPVYYSQPERAPLFGGAGLANTSPLSYLEIPGGTIGQDSVFPLLPASGLTVQSLSPGVGREMEEACIRPHRASVLLGTAAECSSNDAMRGATPQGLLASIKGKAWEWIAFAGTPDTLLPELRLTCLSDTFRQALQKDPLLLSLAHADELMKHASVPCQLDRQDMQSLQSILPEFPDVWEKIQILVGRDFECEEDFVQAIRQTCPDIPAKAFQAVITAAARFRLVAEDWCFNAAPRKWPVNAGDAGTVLIVKYSGRHSLKDLMNSPREGFGFSEEAVRIFRASLAGCYNEKGELNEDYADFVRKAEDPAWSGFLVLNCPLNVSYLPPEIRFILGNIGASELKAHHVGVQAGCATNHGGELRLTRSGIFGLIDYRADQAALPSSEAGSAANSDFDFVTTRLTVGIRNSAVTRFASSSELKIGLLFGTATNSRNPEAAGRLVLDGSSQIADGQRIYQFTLRQGVTYGLPGNMIDSVEITGVALSASVAEAGLSGTFALSGNLRFRERTECDILSYGDYTPDPEKPMETASDSFIAFSGLSLTLNEKSGKREFRLHDESLSLDPQKSRERPDSMAARFPLMNPVLLHGKGNPQENAGYLSITCPIQQSRLEGEWSGLSWTIPLGSLGGNSDGKGLNLQLLDAWGAPDAKGNIPSFIGIKLPGMSPAGASLSLQGFVQLFFRAIELAAYARETGREYNLRFRDFGLRALGLSFPPGHNEILLFGKGKKLGWYAACGEEAGK